MSATVRSVVYAGRRAPLEAGDHPVLSEFDIAPRRLFPALDAADLLVLLDPLSFPYDSLRPVDREIPLVVVLDPALSDSERDEMLGNRLLAELGPGDRVAAPSPAQPALSDRHGWPDSMYLDSDPSDPAGVLAAALAPGVTASRTAKAAGRRRAASLDWVLDGAYAVAPAGTVLRVVDVDGAAGRWLRPRNGTRWSAVASGALGEQSEESADAVVAFGLLSELDVAARHALVVAMWRVARPAGRVVLVDEAVPETGAGPSHSSLPRLLLAATGRRVLLDRVHSHRLPGEVMFRHAAVSAVKTGAPRRW